MEPSDGGRPALLARHRPAGVPWPPGPHGHLRPTRRLAAARRPLAIVGARRAIGADGRLGLPARGVRPAVEVLDLLGTATGGRRLRRHVHWPGRRATLAASTVLGAGRRPASARRPLLVTDRGAVRPLTALRRRPWRTLHVDVRVDP